VEDGTITTVHDTIDTFTDNAILTTSGKEIKTDMVICGTGYTESWDFFSKELQDILVEDDGVWLYKEMLHPDLKNLAFCGRASTFCSPLHASLQSLWLLDHYNGNIQLPSQQVMIDEIDQMRVFKRSVSHWVPQRSAAAQKYFYQLLDGLLTDMGFCYKRQPLMEQFSALAYAPVLEYFNQKCSGKRNLV